jgi:ADP-ribosylglycohydrolase
LGGAISIGGDTDTIASLTGQIAGTVIHAAGVPNELFDGVQDREEIFRIAKAFAKFVSTRAA